MQDTLNLKGLSPSEQAEAEKAKRAERTRIEVEEEREDARMSSIMDMTGIEIRPDNKRNHKQVIRRREQSVAKQMMQNCLLPFGIVGASIQSIFKNVAEFAHVFGASLSQTHRASAQPIELAARDDHFYYDTVAVSERTAEILNEEVVMVARLVKELEAEKSPALRARLQMEFNDTIAYLEMRQHPKTGMHVHDYNHIWTVEWLNNPDEKLNCIDSVCFYTPLANVANLRGVKINPRVAFNDGTPEEVALSHNEKVALAAAQPVPAPRVS